MEAFPPGTRGTVAVISEQCHRTKGHRKLGLERGQQFRERVKDGTPFTRDEWTLYDTVFVGGESHPSYLRASTSLTV
jgi:hypothetical protein